MSRQAHVQCLFRKFFRLTALVAVIVGVGTFLLSGRCEAQGEFDNTKVIIGQYVYKPYYTESGGGLSIDLWSAAFKAVDITPEIRMLPLNRAKQMLIDGEIDMFGGGETNFSPQEREQYGIGQHFYCYFTLALAYYSPNLQADGLTRLRTFETLNQLSGMTFGSTSLYPGIPLLQEAGLQFVEYTVGGGDVSLQQLRMLKAGRFDTTQIPMLSALSIIDEHFSDEEANFGLTKPFAIGEGMRFYNQNNPRSLYFHQKCVEGMDLIMQGGNESEYYRILESYWGKGNVPVYVLPDSLKEFGVEKLDLQKVLTPPRNENWKIVTPAK